MNQEEILFDYWTTDVYIPGIDEIFYSFDDVRDSVSRYNAAHPGRKILFRSVRTILYRNQPVPVVEAFTNDLDGDCFPEKFCFWDVYDGHSFCFADDIDEAMSKIQEWVDMMNSPEWQPEDPEYDTFHKCPEVDEIRQTPILRTGL